MPTLNHRHGQVAYGKILFTLMTSEGLKEIINLSIKFGLRDKNIIAHRTFVKCQTIYKRVLRSLVFVKAEEPFYVFVFWRAVTVVVDNKGDVCSLIVPPRFFIGHKLIPMFSCRQNRFNLKSVVGVEKNNIRLTKRIKRAVDPIFPICLAVKYICKVNFLAEEYGLRQKLVICDGINFLFS